MIFILSFVWIFNFSIRGIDSHHDAIVFVPAFDVINGKVLLRETFTQYGVLMTYIHTFFLYLFGPQLLSIKIATVFFYSLTAFFLWLSTKKLVPSFLALLTVIIWILIAPYYEKPFYSWAPIYGAFFHLVVLFLFITDRTKFNPNYLLLIGVFSALAFWSKQTFLLLFLSVNVYFVFLFFLKSINLKTLIKNIYFSSLGFITVSLIFLSYIVLTNSISDFWLQTIRTGYTSGRIIGSSFNPLEILTFYIAHPFWFFFLLSVLFFLILGIKKLVKNSKSRSGQLFLGLALISMASLVRVYPMPDISHFYWAVTPVIGVTVYFLYLAFKSNLHSRLIQVIIILIVVLFLLEAFGNLGKAYRKTIDFSHPLNYRGITNGIYVSSNDKIFYNDLQNTVDNYLKNHPSKKLLLLHPDAMYLTYSNKDKRIKPFVFNFSGFTSGIYPEYLERVKISLEQEKPLVLHELRYTGSIKGYEILKSWDEKDLVILTPID